MKAATMILGCALAIGLGVTATPAPAREPTLKCVLLDPSTIRCRGGFAEGQTAPGGRIEVIDHAEKTILAGKLGKDSTLTFARPRGGYYVLFDVGPGEQAIVEHDEIRPPRTTDKAAWVRR